MNIKEFLLEVGKLFTDNFPENDCTGLIVLAVGGDSQETADGGRVVCGEDHVLRALVSMNIDHEDKDNARAYNIVRDCFGHELTRRVKAGVETGIKALATKNIKDGKYIVKPPKEKS